MRSPSAEVVALWARTFLLLTLAGISLFVRDEAALVALAAVGAIWLVLLSGWARRLPTTPTLLAESVLVAGVCAAVAPQTLGPMPLLAVLPFVAGLAAGGKGVAQSLVAQGVSLAAVTAATRTGMPDDHLLEILTWLVLGLGLGVLAVLVRREGDAVRDAQAPYRDARHLIRQLLDLSRDLRGGLDPVSIGHRMLVRTRDVVPTTRLTLYVPSGDDLVALVGEPGAATEGERDSHDRADDLAAAVWGDGVTRVQGPDFAFRIATDAGMVGVVVGAVSERVDPDPFDLHRLLRDLLDRLQPLALQLDAALLFAEVRDAATTEERRRLGREMHDGVAQDIASMGYLVDAMLETASGDQRTELELLRATMTRVLREVRRSVQTLRADVDASPSLGAAIGEISRNLTDVSGVPIRIRLEEGTTRLWPSVEAELVRITQEALQNAIRHAGAEVVEVSCRVQPPGFDITVRDDGLGIRAIRPDSHGLQIMRERATLIAADLDIRDAPGGGTVVSVRHRPSPDDYQGDPDRAQAGVPRTTPSR